jgi:phytoene dehydrogenase-like protein
MALNVAIIGGGVAGLSLGTYLQLNGFETEIFEKQDFPGGVCTSWKRKGFMIDGGIRSMVGTKPSNAFHSLWNDVVDLDEMEFHYPEAHFEIVDGEGRRIVFYTDLEKLEAELLKKCPSDKKAIRNLIQTVSKYEHFSNFSDKPPRLMKTGDQASLLNRMLPRLFSYTGLNNTTNRDYSGRFSDPLLKRCFTEGFEPDLPVITSILHLARANDKEVGYPIGGGVFIARRLEKKYLELGGTVHYNRQVDKVLVDNDKATGVACCDGEAFYADIVISAADGRSSLYHMLDKRYIDKAVEERYESDSFTTSPPLLVYSAGVNADMSEYPSRIIFPVGKKLRIDPKTAVDHLDITNFSHDPVVAPSGKSLLTFTTPAHDWKWWIDARKNDSSTL